MNKFTKKDYINIAIITVLYLIVVLLITHGKFMYGSTVDWDVQHWAIPEYFRNLFYSTKELIPNFAPNIGGGQNIFYFAYYGFLSPIILISYLLPNIQMCDYITGSSIISGIISAILLYKWLRNNNFNSNTSFIASIVFLCAGPLIFQSHRHVMFMNYLPFLIMGLMGVDHYFKTGKRPLLIISVFLVIMTSYFYSVGGIFAIVIYGIYSYLKKYEKPNLKNFITEAIKFAIPIIIAILMACILLLPVYNALTTGRIHGDVPLNIKNLIIPHFGLEYVLYSPYSVGLTAILIIALFSNLIFKSLPKRFLNITLIAIITSNIFVYILNGTLYLDGKALIPLLPLYAFVIADFFKSVFTKQIAFYNILSMFAISLLFAIIFANPKFTALYIIDGLLMIFLLYRYYNHQNEKRFIIPFIIVIYIICISINFGDKLTTKVEHQKQNSEEIKELVDLALAKDSSYYRIYTDVKGPSQSVNRILNEKQNILSLYSSTYNKEYNRFFYHTFNNNLPYRNSVITHENKNIMFETFMGVKYLITDKSVPLGYELIKETQNYKLYANKNTMPIGYASSNVLSEKQYKSLKYPYKLESLINNVIVKDTKQKALTSHMKKAKPQIKKHSIENLDISKDIHKYHVKTKTHKNGFINLQLNEKIKDKLVLIRIHVSNPQSCTKGDTAITINGVKNKLTCREWKYYNHNQTFDYTLSSSNGLENFEIKFSPGEYTINAIQIYTLDYNEITTLKDKVDPLKIDKEKTKGDHLSGSITVKENGYFMLTIPYDDGFKIKVDGKETEYEKVSGAFIGFPINKGEHQINISYIAPNFEIGKKLSIFGLILFGIILIYDLIFKRKKVKR